MNRFCSQVQLLPKSLHSIKDRSRTQISFIETISKTFCNIILVSQPPAFIQHPHPLITLPGSKQVHHEALQIPQLRTPMARMRLQQRLQHLLLFPRWEIRQHNNSSDILLGNQRRLSMARTERKLRFQPHPNNREDEDRIRSSSRRKNAGASNHLLYCHVARAKRNWKGR